MMIDAQLPLIRFNGKITLVETHRQWDAAHELLGDLIDQATDEHPLHLGFDTETRPSFQRGERHKVCLLQLSTDHHAFLIRLHKVGLPALCKYIMESPEIIKAGLAAHDDIKGLQQVCPFVPQGMHDVALMARSRGDKHLGLQSLAHQYLGSRVSKSAKLTNWEREHLEEDQLNYAATDAWATLQIYRAIKDAPPPA